jgi:hypothetical protein
MGRGKAGQQQSAVLPAVLIFHNASHEKRKAGGVAILPHRLGGVEGANVPTGDRGIGNVKTNVPSFIDPITVASWCADVIPEVDPIRGTTRTGFLVGSSAVPTL